MKLQVSGLEVVVNNKKVLRNLNLDINSGETHVIMGPNGIGKSTLSKVIMGDNNYKVTSGDILFEGKSILNLPVDERSRLGIFLAMQYPLEIEGVSNQDFLRTAISNQRGKNVGLYEFMLKCEDAINELQMDKTLIHRSLNVGFSGGEKKKNEVLQIKLLKPTFIILDELDSGLDVDSLKIVSENITKYKDDNPDTSILVITHHPKILESISPDYVHIMKDGQIVKTGDYNLALEIEKTGYSSYYPDKEVTNE